MRRSAILFMACASAALAPSHAFAEKALFSASGFTDPREAKLLESALARAMNAELLDATAVSEALATASAQAKPAADRDPDELLRRAHEAFVELRLGDAKAAYDRALEAILDDERDVASAQKTASIFFGRALVALASHQKASADRDLLAAVTLDAELAPDPDVYGPPVLRAVGAAKRTLGSMRAVQLKIDRAPSDAEVRVDGKRVAIGETIAVRGPGPHLITSAKIGYRPRSKLLKADARALLTDGIVLERASGALLAAQTLDAWKREPGELSGERGEMIARCLGISAVVQATWTKGQDIDLVLRKAESGEVLRSVRGRRNDWEPHAYAALAESLQGRTLEPPPAPLELTLALSAPTQVEPASPIALLVDVRDPGRKLSKLTAHCGAATAERAIHAIHAIHANGTNGDASRITMTLDAPNEETTVPCAVRGFADDGALIVEAPKEGEISVAVVEAPAPWYQRWYVWGVIGTAIAGGAVLAITLRQDRVEPDQVLVFHGPN